MNDIRNKIAVILGFSVAILWFFVADIGAVSVEHTYNSSIIFGRNSTIFLLLSITFVILSLITPKIQFLPKLTLRHLLLICSTICFSIFWYLKKDSQISSQTHFLSKENDKYKFIDTDFSQISIVYGTIVAEPDRREDVTNIIIKPDRIILSPRKKYTIELDTSSAKIFVEEEVVIKVVDGDTFVTRSNNIVRLIGVNAPEIGQPKAKLATEFLKQKVLNKKVKLIIQDDYIFDIYGRTLAVAIVDNENVNKSLVDNNLAEIYSDPNIRIIKKVLTYKGNEIKIQGKSGLIRARVKPTVGDYYFKMSYGDYVKIVSPLLLPKKLTNFTRFDYRGYLNTRGIYAVTKTLREPHEIEYLGRGKVNFIMQLAFVLRNKILTIIQKVTLYQRNIFLEKIKSVYCKVLNYRK